MKKDEKVSLYGISVDPPDVSREFAKKIASDGKGEVGFPLLSDPEHRTIDAYGLRDPAYEGQKVYGIPHPAVYVIDKQGKVAWAKIESDYKQRPTNEEIRAVQEVSTPTQTPNLIDLQTRHKCDGLILATPFAIQKKPNDK